MGPSQRTAHSRAPTALLMLGVNEKENRGTPAGRFTRETFERGFAGEAGSPPTTSPSSALSG